MGRGDLASFFLVQPSHYGGDHFFASLILSPPFTYLDLIRGCFIPGALPTVPRFTVANGFHSNVQRRFSFDLVQECDREYYLDFIFDLYSPPSDLDWCDSESGLF